MAFIILALFDSTITGPGTIVKLVEGLRRKPSLLLHLLMSSGIEPSMQLRAPPLDGS